MLLVICLAAVAVLFAVVAVVFISRYVVLRRKNRDSRFVKWLASRIEADNVLIYKLLGKTYEGSETDSETSFMLVERLRLLDRILVSVISGNATMNSDTKEKLVSYVSDKDRFMADTYRQYKKLHPAFISYLRKHGLTEWEAGYCCLYILGLNGKEIGRFLGRGGHYNINSAIRKKLHLTSDDASLGIHLRSQFKRMQQGC